MTLIFTDVPNYIQVHRRKGGSWPHVAPRAWGRLPGENRTAVLNKPKPKSSSTASSLDTSVDSVIYVLASSGLRSSFSTLRVFARCRVHYVRAACHFCVHLVDRNYTVITRLWRNTTNWDWVPRCRSGVSEVWRLLLGVRYRGHTHCLAHGLAVLYSTLRDHRLASFAFRRRERRAPFSTTLRLEAARDRTHATCARTPALAHSSRVSTVCLPRIPHTLSP